MGRASIQEVISGQHIEKRKQNVSVALSVYQKNGWQLPSYAAALHVANEVGKSVIPRLISKFVDESSLSKDEIIKNNVKMLEKESWKKTRFYLFASRLVKYIKHKNR